MIRYVMRYIRWYHVVGLLLGFTVIIGVFWWLKEHERARILEYSDETDLVEAA